MNSFPSQGPYLWVIHPGALGDVLLSLQAIRALRLTFPHHELILISKRAIGCLLQECGEVDRVWDFEGPVFQEFLSGPRHWYGRLHSVIDRTTHALWWGRDVDGHLRMLFEKAGVTSVLIRSPHDQAWHSRHAEDRFLESLGPWECMIPRERKFLKFRHGADREVPSEGTPSYLPPHYQSIVVHPGSGSPHKCVSPALLAQVMEKVRVSSGLPVLVCGGPSDELSLESLKMELPPDSYGVMYQKDLGFVARLLTHAALFLGHDSGLTHLAAAMGVPTVALFGPTDPSRWGPRGPHVSIVTGPPCSCGDWEKVKTCHPKSCLHISPDVIVKTCECRLNGDGHSAEAVSVSMVNPSDASLALSEEAVLDSDPVRSKIPDFLLR